MFLVFAQSTHRQKLLNGCRITLIRVYSLILYSEKKFSQDLPCQAASSGQDRMVDIVWPVMTGIGPTLRSLLACRMET